MSFRRAHPVTMRNIYIYKQGIGRYKNIVTHYSYSSFCQKVTSSRHLLNKYLFYVGGISVIYV